MRKPLQSLPLNNVLPVIACAVIGHKLIINLIFMSTSHVMHLQELLYVKIGGLNFSICFFAFWNLDELLYLASSIANPRIPLGLFS